MRVVSMPQMVLSSTMDAESTVLVRDYVNELMVCVVSFLSITVRTDGKTIDLC